MSKSIEFLRQLADKLHTQDNAYTASPNYCIQEYQLITGLDTDFGGEVGWFDTDNYTQADHKKSEALDRYHDRYGKEPDGWTRTAYDWHWRYTGISFLTHNAAQAYVANNGHRHENELRVYVDSHYRNAEMREVRRLLAGPVADCIEALNELQQAVQFAPVGVRIIKAAEAARNALASLDTAKEPQQ